MYTVTQGSNAQRAAVHDWLKGLDGLRPETADRVVTAWVTSWTSSDWAEIGDVPFSAKAPGYPLANHVNEVTLAGRALIPRAEADWGVSLDPEIILPILILHDVDKPLLATKDGEKVVKSSLAARMPHGVVGAMLLRELGFDQRVVETVATHATDAPFHNDSAEAHVLHYADLFAADHALRVQGLVPFYRR